MRKGAASRFLPYSRVVLNGLTKNLELNGQGGAIVPQEASVWPEVQGCLKVRLDSGQEVAVKAANLALVAPPSMAHLPQAQSRI